MNIYAMHNYIDLTDLLTYLMFVQYVVCLIFQELGLVITGTLPVFNKTNTGSKVNRSLILDPHITFSFRFSFTNLFY